MVNFRTGNRVSWTSTACAFCDHSTNVLSVSYTVHIHFVDYTSVTVGNVSGYRCVSDCRSRGREFDPGLIPYFHGD